MAIELVRGGIEAYERLKSAGEKLLDELANWEGSVRDEEEAFRDALNAPEPVLVHCAMCTAVQVMPATWAEQGLECGVCGSGVGLFAYDATEAAKKDARRTKADLDNEARNIELARDLDRLTQENLRLRRRLAMFRRLREDDDALVDESINVCRVLRIDMDGDYNLVEVADRTRRTLDELCAMLGKEVRDESAVECLQRILDERERHRIVMLDVPPERAEAILAEMRDNLRERVAHMKLIPVDENPPLTKPTLVVPGGVTAGVFDRFVAAVRQIVDGDGVATAPSKAALTDMRDALRADEDFRQTRVHGGVARALLGALVDVRKIDKGARWDVIVGAGLDGFAVCGVEHDLMVIGDHQSTIDVDVTWRLVGATFAFGNETTTVWLTNEPVAGQIPGTFATATVDADHPMAKMLREVSSGPLEVIDTRNGAVNVELPPVNAPSNGKGYLMLVDGEAAKLMQRDLQGEPAPLYPFEVHIVCDVDRFGARQPEKLTAGQADSLLLATLRVMQLAGVEPWPVVERLHAQRIPPPERGVVYALDGNVKFKADDGREAILATVARALDAGWVVNRDLDAEGHHNGWRFSGPTWEGVLHDGVVEAIGDELLANRPNEVVCTPWSPWKKNERPPKGTRVVHPHQESDDGDDVVHRTCLVCGTTWGEELPQ